MSGVSPLSLPSIPIQNHSIHFGTALVYFIVFRHHPSHLSPLLTALHSTPPSTVINAACKAIHPVSYRGHASHWLVSLLSFTSRPSLTTTFTLGCSNSLWSKWQDMQCVENCDPTDDPATRVNFEQPVWQTLNMFVGELGCESSRQISEVSFATQSSPY